MNIYGVFKKKQRQEHERNVILRKNSTQFLKILNVSGSLR